MFPIRRYARLYGIFARNNIVRELEFRGNFWAKIGVNIGFLSTYLLFLDVIFRNTNAIAGWSKGLVFMLFGTFLVSRALMDMLFTQNLSKLPEMIRLGTMDFVLTKPVSSQFFVSARYLSLDEGGTLAGAIAVLCYGAAIDHIHPTMAQIAVWALLTQCGLFILYALQLVVMTLSFWLVRIDNLSALVSTVVDVGRYPFTIFARPLRLGLTFALPLAFVAYIPVLVFKDGIRPLWIAAAFAVTITFLAAASGFYRYAARAYTSASS